jgi:hypothetical protein
MSETRRVRVISEAGRLIGIFAPYPRPSGAGAGAPVGELLAGPGQREHELEIEWPAEREPAAMAEALHAHARKALQLK